MEHTTLRTLGALTLCALLVACGDDGETAADSGVDSTPRTGGNNGTLRNAGRLQFSAPSLSVAEGAAIVTVTVTRTEGSEGAVSVTVTSRDGSATQPADYTGVSTSVSFAAGDAAAKTINVAIAADSVDEPNETLTLTLASPTGGAALGSTSEALLTIEDDDLGAPAAPRGTMSAVGPGLLRLDWTRVDGVTAYRVLKDATGSAGFTQIGVDLPASASSGEVSVSALKEDWNNARYAVAACNAAGCTQSTAISAAGLSAGAIEYIKAASPFEGDSFGNVLALSADGNTMAVGARYDASIATGIGGNPARDCSVFPAPNCASYAGAVHVYTRSNGHWSSPIYIKASDTAANDIFGVALSLSADGNTLAVGADGKNNSQGAVYVFGRDNGTWQQRARLTAAGALDYDAFGQSVALNAEGSMLAVGAPGRASGIMDRVGAVYLYSRVGQTWTADVTLTPPTPQAYLNYGIAVDIVGTAAAPVVVAGASGENIVSGGTTFTGAGAVYVHRRSGLAWSVTRLPNPTPGNYDGFGDQVVLSNDAAVLVASATNDGFLDPSGEQMDYVGAAHVYTYGSGAWSAPITLRPTHAHRGSLFGYALALSADGATLAIGAPGDESDTSGVDSTPGGYAGYSGAAYVFTRTVTSWSAARYLKASNTETNDGFGTGIALDAGGNRLVVGANGEDSVSGSTQLDDCSAAPTPQCARESGAVYAY